MDGFVDFNDFTQINTQAFWKNVDFFKPFLPSHETRKLWLSVFECLEKTATLSPKVIHSVWMRYSTKEDGFIYQEDMEGFLKDFMEATTFQWPEIDHSFVQRFCDKLSMRAAIALRCLTGDDSKRVSNQQFRAIRYREFWVHVDFFSKNGSLEKQQDELKKESFVEASAELTQVRDYDVESILKTLNEVDVNVTDMYDEYDYDEEEVEEKSTMDETSEEVNYLLPNLRYLRSQRS